MRGGPLGTIWRSTGTVTVPFTALLVKTMEPEFVVPAARPAGSTAKNEGTTSFLRKAPVTAVSETVRVPCPALERATIGENGYSSFGAPSARRSVTRSVEGTAIGWVVTRIVTGMVWFSE